MPFGDLPTSGGGLRCWQLMKGLEAHGIEVHASMPGFTYLAEKHYDKIPLKQRELLWRWETQDTILKQVKPDAVLFASNWDHYNITKPLDVPLIIDLHGSRLIETTMWNQPVSTDRKVKIFSKADCLLAAGTRQRLYFYGWLMQAGRVPREEHFIRYIPVSLSPDLPEHVYPEPDDPRSPVFVSGGGWFPWQNQAKAIFAVCRAVRDRGAGTVDIFGTPHETQNMSAEELFIRDIYRQVQKLSTESDRIRVNGYIGRNDLINIYRHASVALEAMRYNLERELAFTTRTIEYLWCGLPVVYNNFGEISEHIRDYNAGWTVDPDDAISIDKALDEIFCSRGEVERRGRNAARLVRDRFAWDKTILPLVEFLKNPQRAWTVEPVVGNAHARASFLSPAGTLAEIACPANEWLEQKFIVPAENIKRVELCVDIGGPESADAVQQIELRLRNRFGITVSRKRIAGHEIGAGSTRLFIDFPIFARPSGGDPCSLALKIAADAGAAPAVTLRGLMEQPYPLLAGPGFPAHTLLDQEVRASVFSLTFMPASDRYYRLKSLVDRCFWLVRKGEFRRLFRAGAKRIPFMVYRLKQAALG